MTEYTIVIEEAGTNLAACVIGLDGVITTGQTVDEVVENMREAIPFHLEGMRLHGDEIHESMPIVKTIHVASSFDEPGRDLTVTRLISRPRFSASDSFAD